MLHPQVYCAPLDKACEVQAQLCLRPSKTCHGPMIPGGVGGGGRELNAWKGTLLGTASKIHDRSLQVCHVHIFCPRPQRVLAIGRLSMLSHDNACRCIHSVYSLNAYTRTHDHAMQSPPPPPCRLEPIPDVLIAHLPGEQCAKYP
jgi:hypothetical protein